MPNQVLKLLIYLDLIKVDSEKIENWIKLKNYSLLTFSLNYGIAKNRIRIIDFLTSEQYSKVLPKMTDVAWNDYENVALKALDSIKILDLQNEYKIQIFNIEKYWKKRLENKNNRKFNRKGEMIDKQKRMQNLSLVKQQLKKPMNIGKWI